MFALVQFCIDDGQETIMGVFSNASAVQKNINEAAMNCSIGAMVDFEADEAGDYLWVCLPMVGDKLAKVVADHHIRQPMGVITYSGVNPGRCETGYFFYVREVKELD